MTPKFTQYSKAKAIKQGITPHEIVKMLASEKTMVMESKNDEDAMLSYGVIKDKLWVIVSNWRTRSVITVYPATEEERRFYEQENKS